METELLAVEILQATVAARGVEVETAPDAAGLDVARVPGHRNLAVEPAEAKIRASDLEAQRPLDSLGLDTAHEVPEGRVPGAGRNLDARSTESRSPRPGIHAHAASVVVVGLRGLRCPRTASPSRDRDPRNERSRRPRGTGLAASPALPRSRRARGASPAPAPRSPRAPSRRPSADRRFPRKPACAPARFSTAKVREIRPRELRANRPLRFGALPQKQPLPRPSAEPTHFESSRRLLGRHRACQPLNHVTPARPQCSGPGHRIAAVPWRVAGDGVRNDEEVRRLYLETYGARRTDVDDRLRERTPIEIASGDGLITLTWEPEPHPGDATGF